MFPKINKEHEMFEGKYGFFSLWSSISIVPLHIGAAIFFGVIGLLSGGILEGLMNISWGIVLYFFYDTVSRITQNLPIKSSFKTLGRKGIIVLLLLNLTLTILGLTLLPNELAEDEVITSISQTIFVTLLYSYILRKTKKHFYPTAVDKNLIVEQKVNS